MTKVISFVSFKGGSGRSVVLANVGFQLAKQYRVGCIDFDIEGGGLHTVFSVGDVGKHSIQHYLTDEQDYYEFHGKHQPNYNDKDTFINQLVIDVKSSPLSAIEETKELKGELYLIQAEPNASLTNVVDTGMNLFYRFNNLLDRFAQYLDLDYLLIDCRSGISNLGLPGLSYSDLTMVFLRWGRQHRYGTAKFVKWYDRWLKNGKLKTKIVVVASTINLDKVTPQMVSDYCVQDLEKCPVDHKIIPTIPDLIDNELIFIKPDTLELQKPFKNLAEMLIQNAAK